jgi:hypothetical protein
MPIFLFTVSGYESRGSQIGLLPGIPQSLLVNHEIGNIKQGSRLLLVLPDRSTIQTNLSNYYLNVPNQAQLDPTTLPIIPVLPPEIKAPAIPIGTEVWAIDQPPITA